MICDYDCDLWLIANHNHNHKSQSIYGTGFLWYWLRQVRDEEKNNLPALQEIIFIKLFNISEVANFGPKERAAYPYFVTLDFSFEK